MWQARWIAVGIAAVALACGTKRSQPARYECEVTVEGGVPGALVVLGDTELGLLDRRSDRGELRVRGSIDGIDVKAGQAMFRASQLALRFETPCGEKTIPLEIAAESLDKAIKKARVPDQERANLPDRLLVYSDGDIGQIKIGAATPGAKTKSGIVRTNVPQPPHSPAPDLSHAAPLYGASCAASLPIEVGGKKVGELDTGPLHQNSAAGHSIFVPIDASRCFAYDALGYGDAIAGRTPQRLAGAAAYVLAQDRIDYLMMPAPSSVQAGKFDKAAWRVELVAATCK